MSQPVTQLERLARIETILETKLDQACGDVAAIRKELTAHKVETDADKADLAALKNKGAGILVGVGLAGGALGALFDKLLEAFR
jgi:hypothetical protein